MSSQRLIACFDEWKLCGSSDTPGWNISDELARRGELNTILHTYWSQQNFMIRNGMEHVAYHFDTPEVTAFMRQILARHIDDGEHRYWPVNYLAKKCDVAALKELSSGRYRNQGSLQYQTSVELFGKCKYRQAIPHLVRVALYDFSFNIVIAAEHSLQAIYQDAPKDFGTLAEMQGWYCARARHDGFRFSTCEAGAK